MTPKPERLIQRVLHIGTNPAILFSILPWFRHDRSRRPQGRHYIGIEMGEHAMTHCAPRLAEGRSRANKAAFPKPSDGRVAGFPLLQVGRPYSTRTAGSALKSASLTWPHISGFPKRIRLCTRRPAPPFLGRTTAPPIISFTTAFLATSGQTAAMC